MRGRICQIGHSRGIRIPKQMLEETGLNGEVEIHVKQNGILIQPLTKPRAGWAEAARAIAEADEGLLDDEFSTEFDEDQWQW